MPQRVKTITCIKIFVTLCTLAGDTVFTPSLIAQGPELQQKQAEVQQKLALIQQAIAKDKQALVHYTWLEQDTISVKGEVKKQEHFQVRMKGGTSHQKISLDPPASADASNQQTWKEYKDYADQIRTLIQQYLPPNQELLERAYQHDYIKVSQVRGAPGQYALVISNYIKRGDRVTLVFNKVQKSLVTLRIDSYLSNPSDAVNVNVEFSKIAGGPNHISRQTINGVSKQLTVTVQNSNYKLVGD